jgi:hypothetical protein
VLHQDEENNMRKGIHIIRKALAIAEEKYQRKTKVEKLLHNLIVAYTPNSEYRDGTYWYKCSFCGRFIQGKDQFKASFLHDSECTFIMALRWLQAPLMPYNVDSTYMPRIKAQCTCGKKEHEKGCSLQVYPWAS